MWCQYHSRCQQTSSVVYRSLSSADLVRKYAAKVVVSSQHLRGLDSLLSSPFAYQQPAI